VDRYGEYLVCQFLSAGAEFWKPVLVDQLTELLQPRGVFERSDGRTREKEGLQQVSGRLRGETPPEQLTVLEHDFKFIVDICNGQKTGFYLDQRGNRRFLQKMAGGLDILNAFAYTGGFTTAALHGGAGHVTSIESSAEAVKLANEQLIINEFDNSVFDNIHGDVFKQLRLFRDSGRQFDLVILDPPKFAESASQLRRAGRAYKDINLLALKLLRPGGYLVTFSCSGHVSPDLFQKIVADAALDANRYAVIVQRLHQADDHPVALHFPESRYLKGLVCRVD
jgi:23S rRNA (cytosine1962-C5)-methyltransferase